MSALAAMLVLSVSASALVIDTEVIWGTRTTIDDIEIVAGGHLIANARVDMGDGGATLTLNGGDFTSNVDFKLPDDWGPATVFINSGTFHANQIEAVDKTGFGYDLSYMVIKDGLLKIDTGFGAGGNYDATTWIANTMLRAADGYELVVNDLGSGAVEITAVVPEPATLVMLGLGGLSLLRKRK